MNINKKITSLFQTIRNKQDKDIFHQTEKRLTTVYISILMIFLFLFIVAVFLLIYFVSLNSEEKELVSMLDQEEGIIENSYHMDMDMDMDMDGREKRMDEIVLTGVDQLFYYVVDTDGDILSGTELYPQMRTSFVNSFRDWNPEEIEFQQKKLHFTQEEDAVIKQDQENITILMAAKPITIQGRTIGTIYVGKDISHIYQLLRLLTMILIGLAIIFSLIAIFISRYMSKKAMVPITEAFDRQKQFVGDASHELRTPLSVMLSSIEALQLEIEENNPFIEKLLNNMRNEVKRMTKLVGDLLTLARADSSTQQLQMESFHFISQAEKTIDSLVALANKKNISMQLEADQDVVINGDQARLSQLLYILLDNAIKYTPENGSITIHPKVEKNRFILSVKDTGIGIKKADQDKIFNRFYRADQARSRQSNSYGLGLSIAKWIVEQHKGSITVQSEEGKGSTFIVSIPIEQK